MADIVIISGSPSATSKSGVLLDYAVELIAQHGLTSKAIAARDFPAQELLLARYDSPVFEPAKADIAQARGVIVSTPVYKASYSGLLKTFLDILPQYAFREKTLLPLANGGSPGHQLAIDYAIKPVLSAMAATDILQGVYAVDAQFKTGADGKVVVDEEIRERLRNAITHLATNVKARPSKPSP